VSHDVAFAVMTDVYDRAVLGVELTDRVVSRNTSVLAECYDYLILENCFLIDTDRLPVKSGDLCRSNYLNASSTPCMT
jgi:hypothetical protein